MTPRPSQPTSEPRQAAHALALERDRVLDLAPRLRVPVSVALPDHDRYRAAGLFALSLDLILGYAGIVSLGHAAFFGVGAYSAGLLALHGIITEPLLALVVAGLVAMVLGFFTSFLVIRGSDLTRLMVTLGIALLLRAVGALLRYHRRHRRAAGYRDAADSRSVCLRHVRQGRLLLLPRGAVRMFLLARRIVHSPFGLSLRAIKNNPLRAAAIGIPVNHGWLRSTPWPPSMPALPARCSPRRRLASLDVFAFERSADLMLVLVIGGTGYLYGGLIGAVVFRCCRNIFQHHAAILAVLDRAGAGGDRAGRPPALHRWMTCRAPNLNRRS